MAINIAIALVDQGLRVVLVDADLYRADIAPLCNLPERGHVGDILSARRDIHEVLERGPGGILVVPGVWAPDHEIPFSQHAQHRFVRQIQSLGRHADMVLMDVGSASAEAVHRFWYAADEVVLVTTPDSVSVMDCYATVKAAIRHGAAPDLVRLIVNKATSADEGAGRTSPHRAIGPAVPGTRSRHLGIGAAGSVRGPRHASEDTGRPDRTTSPVAAALHALATAWWPVTHSGSKAAA